MKEPSYRRVYAAIHLDALEENIKNMKKKLRSDTKMCLVIKTDGYGHGARRIAELAEPYSWIWGFAVATAEEAFLLRSQGIQKPILVLGYTFEEDYPRMVEEEIRPVVFKMDMAEAFSRAAEKAGKPVHVHIGVETGMNRIGFADTQESVKAVKAIGELPGIELEGIFTHFARADEADKTYARAQLLRFVTFIARLEREGVTFPIRHCANSASIMEFPDAQIDMVRAGITTYGILPSDEMKAESLPLSPVMELKSCIVYIKDLKPGESVSYGGTYTATEKRKVATIPVGYGDGYPRSLSNKGWVLIHGKKAPILGRVCMDQFMVDVTDIPEAKELDEVVLLGTSQGERITAEELGALSGRFPYELVCCVGKRVPRVYLREGKVQEVIYPLKG